MTPIYSKHVEGYPTFTVWEGCAYCTDCSNEFANDENNDDDITEDDRIWSRPSEAGIGQSVNWEDQDLYCDQCSDQIEAAY